MGKIYKTDGTITTVEPKNCTDYSLEELQAIVGGYIEVLPLNEDEIMVLNEEGKILGLDLNDNATELISEAGMWDDFIVGDVLVCKNDEVR